MLLHSCQFWLACYHNLRIGKIHQIKDTASALVTFCLLMMKVLLCIFVPVAVNFCFLEYCQKFILLVGKFKIFFIKDQYKPILVLQDFLVLGLLIPMPHKILK